MKLDLTCPVEVQEWELLRDDRDHARAYLHFFNLTDTPLRALSGAVDWVDADSGARLRSEFAAEALSAGPRARFTLPVSASGLGANLLLEPTLESVALADGTVWRADPARLREFPAPPRLPGRWANLLAAGAGRDAVCCAQETEGGEWLCVCGRWNPKDARLCLRCRREREDTLRRFSPEALEALSPGWAPPADIEDPISFADLPPEEAPRAARKPPSLLRRVLIAILLAALFASAALGVRVYRYRTTPSAGLMPTSRISVPYA